MQIFSLREVLEKERGVLGRFNGYILIKLERALMGYAIVFSKTKKIKIHKTWYSEFKTQDMIFRVQYKAW